MALDIVLPIRVQRVHNVETSPTPDLETELHSKGFQAGYEEGKLRAEWEFQRKAHEDRKRLEIALRNLENLHHHFEKLIEEHLPELINAALHRVFKKHQFTIDEISTEIAHLLHEMGQAGRLSVECCPAEASALEKQLSDSDLIADQTKWSLISNSNLQSGEFLIKSDLGDVDGRHSSHLRKIRLALETAP